MSQESMKLAAGIDIGTECVKAVVVGEDGRVRGRAVAPTRGYFQTCAHEALTSACEDAQADPAALAGIGTTGFAMECVANATVRVGDSSCHALGAFQQVAEPMTLVDIGGRDPHVIWVDDLGRRTDARGIRRCALGVGSFLMFTARHLDVPPSRLQELAAAAERGVPVSSYCSVFSSGEVLERLREGATREEIALGCMQSIAERIVEIGGFRDPMYVCGGVVDYFPGVLTALQSLAGVPVRPVPDPMYTAAVGAALMTFRTGDVS
jgi:(R)-2-hydroxyacyl-CoA dehydratese activating ATPase